MSKISQENVQKDYEIKKKVLEGIYKDFLKKLTLIKETRINRSEQKNERKS